MIACAIAIETFRSVCGACAFAVDVIRIVQATSEKVLDRDKAYLLGSRDAEGMATVK
jgi:hypothetical protein